MHSTWPYVLYILYIESLNRYSFAYFLLSSKIYLFCVQEWCSRTSFKYRAYEYILRSVEWLTSCETIEIVFVNILGIGSLSFSRLQILKHLYQLVLFGRRPLITNLPKKRTICAILYETSIFLLCFCPSAYTLSTVYRPKNSILTITARNCTGCTNFQFFFSDDYYFVLIILIIYSFIIII